MGGNSAGGRIGLQPISASLNFNEQPTFDSEEAGGVLPETSSKHTTNQTNTPSTLYEPHPSNIKNGPQTDTTTTTTTTNTNASSKQT